MVKILLGSFALSFFFISCRLLEKPGHGSFMPPPPSSSLQSIAEKSPANSVPIAGTKKPLLSQEPSLVEEDSEEAEADPAERLLAGQEETAVPSKSSQPDEKDSLSEPLSPKTPQEPLSVKATPSQIHKPVSAPEGDHEKSKELSSTPPHNSKNKVYDSGEEVISHKEDSSHEVKLHLDKPYISSYGQIRMDDNKKVDKWINYFQTNGQERMQTYLSRSARYLPMMRNVLRENRLPEELVYVAMIESGFSSRAKSFANAVGYWQFIESTGRRYGLKINGYVDERRDPVLSTRAAARYFKDLYSLFEDWHLALASYNAGEYRVNRSMMTYYTRDFWYLIAKKSIPRETANYVPKFIAAFRISQNPKKYGFDNISYQEALQYDILKLNFPVSLKKTALRLGVEYAALQKLNPRYRSEYVPLEEDETVIRIPVGKSLTEALLAECRMDKPSYVYSDYYWYRVRRGDTLFRLARRARTSVSSVRRLNKMSSRSILRAGRRIKLPYYNRAVKKKYPLAKVHIVKKGESLSALSKKYKVKLKKLREINKLSARALIHPGQVLKLIESPGKRELASSKRQQQTRRIHVVRRGDTLIGIAKKYNVSLPKLMKKNALGFRSILTVGRRIVIPK